MKAWHATVCCTIIKGKSLKQFVKYKHQVDSPQKADQNVDMFPDYSVDLN